MTNKDELETLRAQCEEYRKQVDALTNTINDMRVCKRCGQDVNSKALEINEEDKKAYFKTLITKKPFQKTFELMDGTIKVTFEVVSGELLKMQNRALRDEPANTDIVTINDLLICSALTKVQVYDEDTEDLIVMYEREYAERVDMFEDINAAIDELSGSFDQIMLTYIRAAFTKFGTLMKALIDGGLDKNFYEGAGLH